jgi:hypothetical protein
MEEAIVTIKHLNQIDLSRRWSLSPRSLERWRWKKQGPPFLKVGGRVIYRLADVEEFEAAHMRGVPAGSAEPTRRQSTEA